jgi:hypothetical protein
MRCLTSSTKCGLLLHVSKWTREPDSGRWQVAGGRWQVAGGRWQVAGGRWQVAGGRWQVAGQVGHFGLAAPGLARTESAYG